MTYKERINQNPYMVHPDEMEYYEIYLDTDLREPSVINRRNMRLDAAFMRNVRLKLAEIGKLDWLVREKVVAEITGRHVIYVRFAMKRLAENGMIKRYYRYFRTKSDDKRHRRRRIYYYFGRGAPTPAKKHTTSNQV
jgi:hypothetical protein